MKERLITLAMAAAALVLFWILLFPKPAPINFTPRPLSSGADAEGYFALYRWLTVTAVPTIELHRRFDQLTDSSISATPSGNLLITTLSFDAAPHPQEYAALRNWVDQGNTVLVLAALDDTPAWSSTDNSLLTELQSVTTLKFHARAEQNKKTADRVRAQLSAVLTPGGKEIELRVTETFGPLQGVRHLATHSALASTQWQATATTAAPVLELARRADTADPALWLQASGRGEMVISAYASLFSNDVIGKADNAHLLANLIGWAVKPGGRVIVDDAHQGALDEFDARKFYRDHRLHVTLLWLLALWLAWVLGAQPLRAASPNAVGLNESAMLRTTAQFFAGVLRPVTSAQWLLDEFFARLRHRHGLVQEAGPPWDWLAAHAGVRAGTLDELRELYSQTHAGRRVSLVRLQTLISQISGHTS